MLGTGTFVGLVLLPAYAVGQLMTAEAKCLPGYEWTFNSLNQSPCDVAASLGAVCSATGRDDVPSLPSGYLYSGPYKEYTTDCTCSSVYYSMLSACSYCQSRDFIDWSNYRFNCTTVFVSSYPKTIPSGVTVPAWAYLNVLDGNRFNVTRAQQTRGTESSRPPNSPSTSTSLSTTSNVNPGNSRTNVGAIVGGVVGGVVGLALIVAGILFFFCRKRPSSTKSIQQPAIQTPQYPNPNMGVIPNTFSPSVPPGRPVTSYSHTGDGLPTNYVPQSPFAQSVTTNFTGNSDRPPVITPVPTGYAGVPEI